MLHPQWDKVPGVDSGVEGRELQQQQGQRSHRDEQATVASAERGQSWDMREHCSCQLKQLPKAQELYKNDSNCNILVKDSPELNEL